MESTPAPTPDGELRLAAAAVLAFAASTAFRCWYVLVAHHPRHHVTSDVVALLDLAARFVASPARQSIGDTIWPPGTSAVFGVLMAFDGTMGAAAVFQTVLGGLIPIFVAHTAYVTLGRRAGWVALALSSLHFGFIHYGGFFLSEQLFQVSVVVAVWASVVALRAAEALEHLRRRRARLALALCGAAGGAAWALATTFRPNALPIAVAVGSVLALQAARDGRRGHLLMLAVALLVFAAALAPLARRCTALKGQGFCPVSTNVAMNIALGQSGELAGLRFESAGAAQLSTSWLPPSLQQHGYAGLGTVPTSIYDTTGVLRWVGGRLWEEPGRFLMRFIGNALDLFRFEYWPDDYGPVAERLVLVAKQAFLLLVVGPALVALAAAVRLARRERALSPVWCFLVALVGAVLVTAAFSMGEARYRLPFDGVFILFAASLVADPRASDATPRRSPRARLRMLGLVTSLCAGTVALIALVASPSGAGGPFLARRPAPPAAVTRRAASDFAAPHAAGASWNGPGTYVFTCAPGCDELRLAWTSPERAPALELSLDNNDRYRVTFYEAGRALAEVDVAARPPGPGLRIERRDVPASALATGYDAVGVQPLYGDGSYSLGHLRLLRDANAP